MRVLVTGAGGFVGHHLVKALLDNEHKVFAATREKEVCAVTDAEAVVIDLMDRTLIKSALMEVKPEGIIHLAAISQVKVAWEHPAEVLATNTIGTINLVEEVIKECPNTIFISIGSGEEYGATAKSGEPLSEDQPCFPQNPYAVSKLAAGLTALQLSFKHGLHLSHVRAFNHFGPGQVEGFVVSDFASQIARIERGLKDPVIFVGDLSARRDFTDVRDVVRAYILMLEKSIKPGIYNVCSGIPRQIKYILEFLTAEARIPISVQLDNKRLRISEVPLFVGSSKKLKDATGWQPQCNFKESLRESLEWWRDNLST